MKQIHAGEPSFTGILIPEKIDIIRALNFYSRYASDADIREWARTWIKDHGLDVNLRGRSTGEISTYAAFQRMKERGFDMDAGLVDRLNQAYLDLHLQDVEPIAKQPRRVIIEQSVECISKLDAYIDALVMGEVSSGRIPELCSNKKEIAIIAEVVAKRQAQLEDDREGHTKEIFKLLKNAFAAIVKSLGRAMEVIKTERSKTTAKHTRPAGVVARSVKYLKEFMHFEGLHPEKVVGTKKIYAFDSKSRRLSVFHSTDAGFTFSGTTLKNVDASKSTEKRVKNPEQLFIGLQPTMSALNKIYGLLSSTEKEASGRFNDQTVILCTAG